MLNTLGSLPVSCMFCMLAARRHLKIFDTGVLLLGFGTKTTQCLFSGKTYKRKQDSHLAQQQNFHRLRGDVDVFDTRLVLTLASCGYFA